MQVKMFSDLIKTLYNPPKNRFTMVNVPKMRYLIVDGKGNPEHQDFPAIIKWLYSVVHTAKPATKKIMGKHFAYPPVEFQFWARDPVDFAEGNKDQWHWRVMIICADFIPSEIINNAMAEVENKLGPLPSKARLEYLDEGQCVQYLHLGDYNGVAPVCEQLYGEFLPEKNLAPNGYYHEIYLGDPNRVNPKKRKIIIRQPIK